MSCPYLPPVVTYSADGCDGFIGFLMPLASPADLNPIGKDPPRGMPRSALAEFPRHRECLACRAGGTVTAVTLLRPWGLLLASFRQGRRVMIGPR